MVDLIAHHPCAGTRLWPMRAVLWAAPSGAQLSALCVWKVSYIVKTCVVTQKNPVSKKQTEKDLSFALWEWTCPPLFLSHFFFFLPWECLFNECLTIVFSKYTTVISSVFYVYVCFACMYICVSCVPHDYWGGGVSDPLGLELQAAVSCHVDSGNWTLVLCSSRKCSLPPFCPQPVIHRPEAEGHCELDSATQTTVQT